VPGVLHDGHDVDSLCFEEAVELDVVDCGSGHDESGVEVDVVSEFGVVFALFEVLEEFCDQLFFVFVEVGLCAAGLDVFGADGGDAVFPGFEAGGFDVEAECSAVLVCHLYNCFFACVLAIKVTFAHCLLRHCSLITTVQWD